MKTNQAAITDKDDQSPGVGHASDSLPPANEGAPAGASATTTQETSQLPTDPATDNLATDDVVDPGPMLPWGRSGRGLYPRRISSWEIAR